MYGERTPELVLLQEIGPEDLNTAGNNGTWFSMAAHRRAELHIFIGDLAGGAAAVTVEQATALAGTGGKALAFTRYYQTGQKVKFTGRSAANFAVGETITGGTSTNTAKVIEVSSAHLIVAFLTGSTTWTDAETITGGTSGATATVSGTGQDEDTLVAMTATSNTFNTIAVAFKHYMIPVDSSMLDVANEFDCVRLVIAQAATGETQGVGLALLISPRITSYPQQSALGAVKIV